MTDERQDELDAITPRRYFKNGLRDTGVKDDFTDPAPPTPGELAEGRGSPSAPSDPASAPATSPSPVYGDTVVKDGKGYTRFGGYERVKDQATGEDTWVNAATGKREVPQSMRMMELMNGNRDAVSLAHAGNSWDDVLRAQNDEKLRAAMESSRRVMEEQRRGAEERRRRVMQRRIDAGAAFGAALSTLSAPVQRGEDGSIFGADGKPIDRRVRVAKSGRIYLMGSAEPGALRTANENRRNNGSASDYTAVMAYREIDRNGNPLKNADGSDRPPMLAVTNQPGGDPKARRQFRTFDSGDVARGMLEALRSQGVGDEDAKSSVVTQVFGGVDPLGWGRTLKPKQTGSASAEAAAIRAASAEKVQQMRGEQALEQIAANNKGKLDLTKLTGEQKQKLLDSANELKKYGIDVGLQIAQEGNASKERIAAQTEAGRNARFAMRDDREWEKLAQGWAKVDDAFAVQMKKADTYGKRVDLLEQKLKNDYDIAMKKAKTADERAKAEAVYKDRMASVAEGNYDLNWFKAETAADQGQQKIDNDKAAKDADRELKRQIAEMKAGIDAAKNGGRLTPDDVEKLTKKATLAEKLIRSGKSEDKNRGREMFHEIAEATKANQTTANPSGDNGGGAGGFVQLSPADYNKLSAAEKAKYREAWKAWKAWKSNGGK